MASVSNSDGDPSSPTAPAADGGRQRKRARLEANPSSSSSSPPSPSPAHWLTDTEKRRYSSKLLDALRRVRPAADAPPRSRLVREAANRVLAVAARGRTRWSRAILSNRSAAMRLKAARRRRPAAPRRPMRAASAVGGDAKKTPVLERKAKALGRLVPGCRKLSFPTLLEEASDYIAALQMQVRAMSELTQILSAVGAPPAAAAAADRPGPSETPSP